jgi:hypothetical protein
VPTPGLETPRECGRAAAVSTLPDPIYLVCPPLSIYPTPLCFSFAISITLLKIIFLRHLNDTVKNKQCSCFYSSLLMRKWHTIYLVQNRCPYKTGFLLVFASNLPVPELIGQKKGEADTIFLLTKDDILFPTFRVSKESGK